MGIVRRISTLVKADAHGVVDAVEDRSLLLRQHLREAELELHRKRARLEAIDAEAKALTEESKRIETTLVRLEEDITLALEGDKEELARFAIKKHIPLKRRLAHIGNRLEEGKAEREHLVEVLEQHEAEFQELRSRVKAHLSHIAANERGDGVDPYYEPVIADEEVELELLRRTSGHEAGGES